MPRPFRQCSAAHDFSQTPFNFKLKSSRIAGRPLPRVDDGIPLSPCGFMMDPHSSCSIISFQSTILLIQTQYILLGINGRLNVYERKNRFSNSDLVLLGRPFVPGVEKLRPTIIRGVVRRGVRLVHINILRRI
jgi:hypothetical protein